MKTWPALALAIVLPGGFIVAGLWGLYQLSQKRSTSVSRSWLAAQFRRDMEARNAFIGPVWSWPVKKLLNESGTWNRAQSRKRA